MAIRLGLLGATAILAAVPDARMFNTARDFAAWLHDTTSVWHRR
jgi:transposase